MISAFMKIDSLSLILSSVQVSEDRENNDDLCSAILEFQNTLHEIESRKEISMFEKEISLSKAWRK